jgi:uncharacterized protein (TIGR02453 family)
LSANPIRPSLFRFFRELKRNNDRDWFRENKSRYENDVKDPCLQFIADFAAPLRKISPHFRADPRPVGGSLFRIHRDTRFSKDKTPYKTAAGIHFRHERAKDAHAPGFYLHLGPGEVFVGAGIWHPDGKALGRIRDAIVDDPAAWKRITGSRKLRDGWDLAGDSLKRPPRGYDPEHPLVDDLRRKDFIVVASLTEKEACAPDFPERFATKCRDAAPLVRFVAQALELGF